MEENFRNKLLFSSKIGKAKTSSKAKAVFLVIGERIFVLSKLFVVQWIRLALQSYGRRFQSFWQFN